jgi:hypothetical protein
MSPTLRLLAAAVLGAGAPATAQVNLSWTGGVLGQAVDYQIAGQAGEIYALLPSFNAGPTPLAIFDPNDPRVLDVGLDLFALLQVGLLPPAGTAHEVFPLPASTAVAGLTLHAQAVTLPGAATLVDDISQAVKFDLQLPGGESFTQNELAAARRFHSASTLPDGRVLVVGGQTPDVLPVLLDTLELFDPQTQSFAPGGMVLPDGPRSHHTATTLQDGRVLFLGGIGASGVLSTGLTFDPATGAFQPTAPMGTVRVLHTATLLDDGRVLVVGGSQKFTLTHPIGYPDSFLTPAAKSVEIYDPATNSWQLGPRVPVGLSTHSAALLGSGRVLIAGGVESGGTPLPQTTSAAYLYDPLLNLLLPTQPAPFAVQHSQMIELDSGDALMVGGSTIDFATGNTVVSNQSSKYSASGGGWGPIVPCTIIIRCGRIIKIPRPGLAHCVLLGGLSSLDLVTGAGVPQQAIARYDQASGNWATVGSTILGRGGVDVALFDAGARVLVTGSAGGLPPDKSAEIFIPLP